MSSMCHGECYKRCPFQVATGAQEGTITWVKGSPVSQEDNYLSCVLKKECNWPRAFQAQEILGKKQDLWKKTKHFGVARTLALGMRRGKEGVVENDTESVSDHRRTFSSS